MFYDTYTNHILEFYLIPLFYLLTSPSSRITIIFFRNMIIISEFRKVGVKTKDLDKSI